MASAVTTERITAELFVEVYDHDPGAATAIIVSPDGGTTERWYDMSDASDFMVKAMTTIAATGGLTKLEIVAATDTSGTGLTVVKDSGTVAADAVGDTVVQSCTAAEVATLGSSLRYVAGRLTMAAATDEAAVAYVAKVKVCEQGKTANAIS